MKEEVRKILDLITKCRKEVMPPQKERRTTPFQEEISVLSNIQGILHEDGDNISITSLIHFSNCIRYFIRLYNRDGNQEGEIDDMCSELNKELNALKDKEIRQQWIDLIGKDRVKFLENQYWVSYDKKTVSVYKTNEIEMEFLMKDRLQDTVIFFSLCYNFDAKKFTTEDCIEGAYCDTYEEAREHNLSAMDKIFNNNFQFVHLPE